MGFDAALTSESAIGEKITYTPDTSAAGAYTTAAFTAPKKGVYMFRMRGSGGANGNADDNLGGYTIEGSGGRGGMTVGYLLLGKGDTVYVGAGGPCSAAFVSDAPGDTLAAIAQADLIFAAGGGGGGSAIADNKNNTGYNCVTMTGGTGGGAAGQSPTTHYNGTSEDSSAQTGGAGGTQSAGGEAGGNYKSTEGKAGAYGRGGAAVSQLMGSYAAVSGRGGDGYYGGGSGHVYVSDISARGYGGGGGSGYVRTAKLTVLGSTYTSIANTGGGAAAGRQGSVEVTYYARAQLPVVFDGVTLERLIFNGTEVLGLIYNGTAVFLRRLLAPAARLVRRCGAAA